MGEFPLSLFTENQSGSSYLVVLFHAHRAVPNFPSNALSKQLLHVADVRCCVLFADQDYDNILVI